MAKCKALTGSAVKGLRFTLISTVHTLSQARFTIYIDLCITVLKILSEIKAAKKLGTILPVKAVTQNHKKV